MKVRDEIDEIFEKGNMYTKEEFQNFLIDKEKVDIFTEKIEP
jgi:hypothetical protein